MMMQSSSNWVVPAIVSNKATNASASLQVRNVMRKSLKTPLSQCATSRARSNTTCLCFSWNWGVAEWPPILDVWVNLICRATRRGGCPSSCSIFKIWGAPTSFSAPPFLTKTPSESRWRSSWTNRSFFVRCIEDDATIHDMFMHTLLLTFSIGASNNIVMSTIFFLCRIYGERKCGWFCWFSSFREDPLILVKASKRRANSEKIPFHAHLIPISDLY